MPRRISATVESFSLPVAATMLGIRGAGRGAVVRSALALFHGHDPITAVKYANYGQDIPDGDSGHEYVQAVVPDELVPAENQSYAVRVGLGLAMGLSRPQAEQWARIPTGRPRKNPAKAAS